MYVILISESEERKMKKKTLKKGVQKTLERLIGVYLVFILVTINTLERPLEEVKTYIIILIVSSIISFISIHLLVKYGK